MRSRMVREGSVGLFILLGLAVSGGLILWLHGIRIGKQSYKLIVEFPSTGGIQVGAPVRYRGVNVGTVGDIKPSTNGVDVTVEITSPDVAIPRDGLLIEASQSGFIGETYIDMKPLKPLPPSAQGIKPLANCNASLIVCDNSRLRGDVGPNFDELIRSTTRVAEIYGDPKLYTNINKAADQVTQLTHDLAVLSRSAQQDLTKVSSSVNSVSQAVNKTADQASLTVSQFRSTANKLGNTADQYSLTAGQLNQFVGNVNNLVQRNRSTLEASLANFSQASKQVVGTVDTLKSTITQANSTFKQFNSAKLANNLETLSTNAATASADAATAASNLRNFTNGLSTLNTRENLVQLQKTLDSAQAVFENARKITSDLDELTGDPAFRANVRNLVNGLGKLVSSTQQLEQQVQVAKVLAPVSDKINTTAFRQVEVSRLQFSSQPLFSKDYKTPAPLKAPLPTSRSTPMSSDSTHNLPTQTRKPLEAQARPSELPSDQEWFVPDDQPESEK